MTKNTTTFQKEYRSLLSRLESARCDLAKAKLQKKEAKDLMTQTKEQIKALTSSLDILLIGLGIEQNSITNTNKE